MESHLKHHELTRRIIGCFYDVYNALGHGFLEKVYENSLAIELRKQGLQVDQQQPIRVYYDNELVGEYFADLVVDAKVIIEVKAVKNLAEDHKAQILNYLKATEYEVGLLLNFGPSAQKDRMVFDNELKKHLPKRGANSS